MTQPDELRSTLDEIASMIDVGDPSVARSEISASLQRRRRRRAGARVVAAVSVVVAGVSVIAWAGRSSAPTVLVGVDPSTTPAPATASSPPPTSPPPATTEAAPPPPPPAGPRIVEPAAVTGESVDLNPYAAQGMGAGFLVPWRDGFLAGGQSDTEQGAEAHFSTDGVSWQPVDIALPDGVWPQSYTVGGDRLVFVGNTPGRSATTVYSSSDLLNWSEQTIEPSPPPIALPDFVTLTVQPAAIVANDDGWIVEGTQEVRLDPRGIVPAADLPAVDQTFRSVDPDTNGVTVSVVEGADAPLQYTWDELGVTAEQSEYILMARNWRESRWWSATWTGDPVQGSGTGVPTTEGFVQLGGRPTQFSPDGVNWTRTATAVLGGEFPVVLPYGNGLVVVDSDDETPIIRRLDARGELIEEILIAGLAPVRMPLSTFPEPSSALVYSATEAVQPVQSMEHDGYRLTYDPANPVLQLVDVATGETIVRQDRDSFEATGVSVLVWDEDGITISDPSSGEVIVTFPNDVVQRSMDEISDTLSQFVPDLRLLATADGEQFVTVDLPDDAGNDGNPQTVVNGSRALVGINGDWTLYDLP